MHLARSLAISVLALGLTAPVFAQALPDRVRQAGRVVIATNPNYPPITYKDPATNQLTGFDIDLGNAIARELGVRAEWQEIGFAQMLPSIQTGRVDMVLAGMADIPTRREAFDFVNYLTSGAQFYTTTALAGQIRAPDDLCGRAVGASRATTWPADIAAWSQTNCVARGRAPITVVGTEGSVDARAQLKTQRLQGAVQGNETMPYFQGLEPDTYILLGTPFTQRLAGIPFARTPDGVQLRAAVRGALERLHASGEYDRILARYSLQANRVERIVENQGE